MFFLSFRSASAGVGRLGLIDVDGSNTICRQVRDINSLDAIDLLGFRQLKIV
jgi:hypothetical protein